MNKIGEMYTEWIMNLVGRRQLYGKLLYYLYSIPFRYTNPMDENRDEDGKALKYRFGYINNFSTAIMDIHVPSHSHSSILEMMVALAIRCEKSIMEDPEIGDRTDIWFWKMIHSLGLDGMTDDEIDISYCDYVVDRFLNREFSRNGEGGLFTIKNKNQDMRTAEIWYQMCWYLDEIIYG